MSQSEASRIVNQPVSKNARTDYSMWAVLWRTVVWWLLLMGLVSLVVGVGVEMVSVAFGVRHSLTPGLVGAAVMAVLSALPLLVSMYDHAHHAVGRWAGTRWVSSWSYARGERHAPLPAPPKPPVGASGKDTSVAPSWGRSGV